MIMRTQKHVTGASALMWNARWHGWRRKPFPSTAGRETTWLVHQRQWKVAMGIESKRQLPGKARNFEELKADFLKPPAYCKKRINLHASYAVFPEGEWVDREQAGIQILCSVGGFCERKNSLGIDFNPTCFFRPRW